jgi:ferredoxin
VKQAVVVKQAMDECWKVTVDRDVCLGTGICVGTAPEHFRLEGYRSRPVEELIDPDDLVLDAAETCPTEAIAVYDGTGRKLAP